MKFIARWAVTIAIALLIEYLWRQFNAWLDESPCQIKRRWE
jgi:hypothetical protein